MQPWSAVSLHVLIWCNFCPLAPGVYEQRTERIPLALAFTYQYIYTVTSNHKLSVFLAPTLNKNVNQAKGVGKQYKAVCQRNTQRCRDLWPLVYGIPTPDCIYLYV